VRANGDKVFEPNETFDVVLSAPTGGTIADATGAGTIMNDDKQPTTLTIHRRLAPTFVIGKGLLEPATVGVRVRVAFFHRVRGHWVKIAAKTVVVTGLRDRDHDGLLDARYVAKFKRPSTHGHYKLRARFAGSAALRRSHRGMNLTIRTQVCRRRRGAGNQGAPAAFGPALDARTPVRIR
jgi:hypothetical protein